MPAPPSQYLFDSARYDGETGQVNNIFDGSTSLHGLCQQVDWTQTSLGPVAAWPPALITAARLCLDAATPMSLWAGPDLLLIYNDGYARILPPEQHPWALGRPARAIGDRFWARLGPVLERVTQHGETLQHSHQGVDYSHTPIRDPDGHIVGSLNVVHEATADARRGRDARRMFELSPELLAVADTNDRYRWVNPAFTRVLGWSEEEMLGHPGIYFVHPDDRDRTSREVSRLASGHTTLHFTNRYRCKDGSYRWLSWTASPVTEDGLIYAAAQDITERNLVEQALRESEARMARDLADLKQLQHISSVLVAERADSVYQEIVEATRLLMKSDAASLQLLDAERDELELLAWTGFHPDSALHWQRLGHDQTTSCGAALKNGTRVVVPDAFAAEQEIDGETLEQYRQSGIVAVQSTPLRTRDGRVVGVLSNHWGQRHEPTEHDLALLDVLARQAADMLERTRSMQTLREADRRKDHFLAMLGHELRHPLAALQSGLLVLDRAGGEGATLKRVVPLMQREIDQLKRLIDDLLNLSRITRNRIALAKERLDLRQVVQEVVDAALPESGRRMRLDLPNEPLMLLGDKLRVKQIIRNILDNAVKYTQPNGGTIRVSAHREGTDAIVRVQDNGSGIAHEFLQRIFDPFEQAGAEDGIGIGLTLARQLVELHGGRVIANSEGIGAGSEFLVHLPLLGRA